MKIFFVFIMCRLAWLMISRIELKLRCVILFVLVFCVGCSGVVFKKKDSSMVDLVDSVESRPIRENYIVKSKQTSKKDSFGQIGFMGTSTVGVVGDRYKIELLDTMSVYEFLLAVLSPISFDLVIDGKIEMSVSCNINTELSEKEILSLVRNVCNSLGLTVAYDGRSCLVSLKNLSSTIGKRVLVYQSRYLKSGQYLSDMFKTFEGVTVFSQGLITVLVASESDIELINNVLVSVDKDIFFGYVYSFVVCDDAGKYSEKLKSVLLGVSSRYEEHIQIITITDNVLMFLTMSLDYLRYVENLSSMIGSYVLEDYKSYSVKVCYRSAVDVLTYLRSVMPDVKLSSDAEQNIIYYSGSRNEFNKVSRLVSAYDRIPSQLLVRLYMIDIKSSNSLNAGTDWLAESGSFGLGQSELIYPLTSGINGMYTVGNIKAFFSFLEKTFDARVVSRPYLYMKSGQSAKIQIGSEVPFVTSKTSQSTVATGIVQNVEYRQVGMIFNLKSTVTDSRDIMIDVSIENSAIQQKAGVEGNPVFTTDNLSTNFIVRDKSLTILGGIKFTDRRETQNGFPFLSRIPVLKYVFGVVDKSYEDRELIIAICPKILDVSGTAEFGKSVFNNLSEYFGNNLIGDKK